MDIPFCDWLKERKKEDARYKGAAFKLLPLLAKKFEAIISASKISKEEKEIYQKYFNYFRDKGAAERGRSDHCKGREYWEAKIIESFRCDEENSIYFVNEGFENERIRVGYFSFLTSELALSNDELETLKAATKVNYSGPNIIKLFKKGYGVSPEKLKAAVCLATIQGALNIWADVLRNT